MNSERGNIVAESEDILITKCIEWDPYAQNRLYDMYSPKMFAVCHRYSRSREEAEDILHEGFMKVFQNIDKFRKEGSLEGWIRRIMYNTAIQKFRQRRHEKPTISLENLHDKSLHHDSDDVIGRLSVKELIGLIQRLPPRYQMVFNLYVFEGLKHREIAEKLGITEGTSKSNLFDARNILQRAIKKGNTHTVQTVKADGRE
jgi:RNA polymerase sigma factor (sigma-70 family)